MEPNYAHWWQPVVNYTFTGNGCHFSTTYEYHFISTIITFLTNAAPQSNYEPGVSEG